ncbi:MAG: phosphatidate cytidylyltransferase [Alphaproteobacteria bacterium]|nr:phosphatidate cytidylyltransferase [Alphaproteobacteria bacterium]
MGKTNFTSLQKRILTSLVMIPIVIGALRSGHPFVDILIFIVGSLLSWEWVNMVPNKKSSTYAVAYTFALGCSLQIFDGNVLFFTLLLTALFVYIKAKDEKHRNLLTLGVIYISIGVGSLYWIYFLFDAFGSIPGEKGSFVMTLWFIIMVWSVDIGGYVVGTNLKGPKLAPSISPNKTWSGLIGGVVLAVAVSFIYMYATRNIFDIAMPISEQIKFGILGAVIAVVAQIGDLIESSIKRYLGVKDSSSLIPGHGGIFDRIDGLIFAAPIVYCYFSLVSFK